MLTQIGRMSEGADLVVWDDRIAVAGWAPVGGRVQFAVVRYLAGGTPDPSFGTGGIALTRLGRQTAQASAIALQGVDRLIVGGSTVNERYKRDTALVRYLW